MVKKRNLTRSLLLIGFGYLVASGSNAWSQLPTTTQAPVTYSNTFLVTAIDANRMKFSAELRNSGDATIAGVVRGIETQIDRITRLSNGHTAYVAMDIPYGERLPFARLVLHKGPNSQEFWAGKKSYVAHRSEVDNCLITTFGEYKTFVAGSPISEDQIKLFEQAERKVANFPVRMLFAPPPYFTETIEQTLPQLPQQLGSVPTTTLTRGMRWAAFGFDPSSFEIEGTIQSDTAADAAKLAKVLPSLLANAVSFVPKQQRIWFEALSAEFNNNVAMKVVDNQIRLSLPKVQGDGAGLLSRIAKVASGPVVGTSIINKLRDIQLAILNYESANRCLPPNAKQRGEDGKSGLSWRVHILPYLAGKEAVQLYNEFRLDEPWDSAHNLRLLSRMPEVYQRPQSLTAQVAPEADQVIPTHTIFLAPVGEGTVFGQNEVVTLRDIKDGTSKTLSVVTVKEELARPWTAPQDYEFSPQDPAAGLADEAYGASVDGAVHRLKEDWESSNLLRLFQRNDAQPATFD